jgi:hypothetical protein
VTESHGSPLFEIAGLPIREMGNPVFYSVINKLRYGVLKKNRRPAGLLIFLEFYAEKA